MPNIGPMEVAIVLIIVLLIFGPKKLPELGRSVGSGLKEFQSGLRNHSESKPESGKASLPEGDQVAAADPVTQTRRSD